MVSTALSILATNGINNNDKKHKRHQHTSKITDNIVQQQCNPPAQQTRSTNVLSAAGQGTNNNTSVLATRATIRHSNCIKNTAYTVLKHRTTNTSQRQQQSANQQFF